ncbi:SDR-family protein [Sphingobium sp. ba1]|jgi:NAD(P)-dependent dehydrogenase (short-subunit alcohol dehydrogenase family)|uniref:SDR family NAD(P)-dependent oxidoreductase n=1 Tax=Sphingobium sp. ba1 TaxID=1522072 RepID=UPI0004FFECCB|nr:SDR family NAD(P)-dependent oxidoreductase [Sphingobium sp. ba1]KFL46025.1 SDR-family protein [Sphingobium sp. ba1]
MRLAGKVALVTGAGRGLGRAYARALAAEGAQVIVNDLGGNSLGEGGDDRPARAVVAEIMAAGGVASADMSDISDWSAAQALVSGICVQHGRLDILVNNAGISRSGLLGDLSEADWDRQFGVNVKGATALIDAAARLWRTQTPTPRAIVNISSPAGPHPIPPIGLYSATKAAMAALTMSAAQELAPLGVRVNALSPIARTRLIEKAPQAVQEMMAAREGYDLFAPDHAARLLLCLCLPDARFTGRLLGCRGDEVYFYRPWSADYRIDNGGAPWTISALEQALGLLPQQDMCWMMTAEGLVEQPWPPTTLG